MLVLRDFPTDFVVKIGVARVEDQEQAGVGAGQGVSAAWCLVDGVDTGCLDLVACVGNRRVVTGVGGDSGDWGKDGEEG